MIGTTTLILTAADDSTADLVIAALAALGGKATRIDVGDFPMALSVTGAICADGIWRGELVAADGAALDLESYRGLGGLLAALPARWVSHPARIADAEAKPVQLRLTAACGFRLHAR